MKPPSSTSTNLADLTPVDFTGMRDSYLLVTREGNFRPRRLLRTVSLALMILISETLKLKTEELSVKFPQLIKHTFEQVLRRCYTVQVVLVLMLSFGLSSVNLVPVFACRGCKMLTCVNFFYLKWKSYNVEEFPGGTHKTRVITIKNCRLIFSPLIGKIKGIYILRKSVKTHRQTCLRLILHCVRLEQALLLPIVSIVHNNLYDLGPSLQGNV